MNKLLSKKIIVFAVVIVIAGLGVFRFVGYHKHSEFVNETISIKAELVNMNENWIKYKNEVSSTYSYMEPAREQFKDAFVMAYTSGEADLAADAIQSKLDNENEIVKGIETRTQSAQNAMSDSRAKIEKSLKKLKGTGLGKGNSDYASYITNVKKLLSTYSQFSSTYRFLPMNSSSIDNELESNAGQIDKKDAELNNLYEKLKSGNYFTY